MKTKRESRPTCSCGAKMDIIEYTGYYDDFKYWRCDECDLDDKIQNAEADTKESGSYA